MKRLFSWVLLLTVASSTGVFAGEKIYRDGDTNPGCVITRSHPPYPFPTRAGLTIDKSKTVHNLTCGGQFVSAVTVPSVVCSSRTGCSLPSYTSCGRAGCQSLIERKTDSANYDFNYDLPGVDFYIDGLKSPELLFGTVSKKTPSNVFSSRPLSKNYIAYSNDGVLDKPVIIVEGYDPTDSLFPNHYFNAGFNQLLLNGVSNNGSNGRDLFIVNLPHGASRISENAAFLQKVIAEINGAKVGNVPAVVIGYSMGGLVARQALKNMELSGVNHKTSVYVSYDVPHLGANAPLDIQATVDRLVAKLDDYTAGYTSSSLKRARYLYNSPAAREMLLSGPEFKTATAADFPERLVRIAVSSGSLVGANGRQVNSVYEGESIASFRFYLWKSSGGALLPSSSLSETFSWYSRNIRGIYYDNVPGSYAQSFSDAYWELEAGADSFSGYQEAAARNITFIPTISSLAMPVDPNTDLKSIFSVKSPFDKYIAVDETPWMNPCDSFRLQNANGKNIYHSIEDSYLDYNQLMQLRCALDTYQVEGFQIPDRSFKRY